MPYTSIYFHIVFRTKSGTSPLKKEIRKMVYRVIVSTFTEKNCKIFCINGVEDHIHIIVGMSTVFFLPDLMHRAKLSATTYIKAEHADCGFKGWNSSYAVISFARKDLSHLIRYVENQELHHADKSTTDEMKSLLSENEIEYDPKYFDW